MADRIWILLMALAFLVFTGLAGVMLPEIDRQRGELQITFTADPHQNLPAEVAIAQAGLGSVRPVQAEGSVGLRRN